jgi:hypothetical protein
MLLEIENGLCRRVHEALGQSAVVLRLAESLDESGRVAEQAMIIVSFTSANTTNPYKGAYIPTVRNRRITYTLTLVQKQVQREGHSFCLPILDLLADSVTGWVPEISGLEFQSGFELESEKFIQVTKEASQFIYEQTYSIDVSIADSRFYSQPCAAFDPIKVSDFLPVRKCLVTADNRQTGLATWRRLTGPGVEQKYVVEDSRCGRAVGDQLQWECTGPGTANYVFIPSTAINPDGTVDNSKVTGGVLSNFWKCTPEGIDSGSDYPDWFKLNIDSGLWRNQIGTLPNTEPGTSARQKLNISLTKRYNGEESGSP